MSFYEWRRFNFFELIPNVDSNIIAESINDKCVVASSSGYGHLVFGDAEGNIYLVTRSFVVTSFRGYELRVGLMHQMRHAPLLVTIGEDEPGINPVIKVWNLDKRDKNGIPMCVRISRTIPNHRPTPVSALCVHDNLNLMAVGFSDGSVILYRGDITRDRSTKHKVIHHGENQGVSGLEFKSNAKYTYLYVALTNSVFVFDISVKDKEIKTNLEAMGCPKNCSTLAESVQDSHFMIGGLDAIYCFTPDGRGPCYAVEGQKVMLKWFRNYLVIVAKDIKIRANTTSPSTPDALTNNISDADKADTHLITILDIQNKFIVLQKPIQDVTAVLSEWGSLYVLSGRTKCTLFHVQEKDVQSKLALLFRKNLYDVAIRIAKIYQYDAEGLADMFRQYGDHLYAKGDRAGAIEQYTKTIGRLEPSYVIRKFLDSQHIENLTTYLQALHKHGHATEDHTTLLLNCYTKLDKTDRLKEFIMTKDREVDFDIEIAIKVCRQASSEDALLLAQKHGMHDWYLKIQTEDHGRYEEALDYIAKLKFNQAEASMKKYGGILLQHAPEKTTQLLKKLCTDYTPSSKQISDQNSLQGSLRSSANKSNPEDFIHLFTECPERLEEFLEYLLQDHSEWNALVYNTLLEHYLNVWGRLESAGTVEISSRLRYEQRIMKLLQNPDARYDKDQVLILCQANNFRPGIILLLGEKRLYQQIIQYHMMHHNYQEILSTCQRFDNQDPNLWVEALWFCARSSKAPPEILKEILQVIERKKLLPPLLVLDALCTTSEVTLANVRNYLLNVLKSESQLAQRERDLVEKYRKESERTREQIQAIQTKSMIFQVSRCSACSHQLELPSIHFLCQHSYHQHCFQSFSENENECPSCLPRNKKILDIIKQQENNRDLHETFHRQLEKAEDGFSLVADYFGRGVFNKLTVVTDTSPTEKPSPPSQNVAKADPISRVSSTPSSSAYAFATNNPFSVQGLGDVVSLKVQQSEPTVRTSARKEQTKPEIVSDVRPTSKPAGQKPVPSSAYAGKNPFDAEIPSPKVSQEKSYPSSKNPFDTVAAPVNPFAEDMNVRKEDSKSDYNKNLNPFAE